MLQITLYLIAIMAKVCLRTEHCRDTAWLRFFPPLWLLFQ